jgi:hypothetical protein
MLGCFGSQRVHSLERKEFEVVLLVEPGAFDVPQRQVAASGKRQRVDDELDMGVRLLPGIGLVIQHMQETVCKPWCRTVLKFVASRGYSTV